MGSDVESFHNLKKLMESRSELMQKLDRSLLIREIWPDAFKDGSHVTSWVSGISTKGFYFYIKRVFDGVDQKYPVQDIPLVLWPEQFKKDCESNLYGREWQKIYLERL